MNWKRKYGSQPTSPLPALVVLSLFFLGGVLLGQVLSGRVPDSTGQELKRYVSDFVQLDGNQDLTSGTILSTLVLYFRYPLLAFLMGFASIGVVLLPCATVMFGFFLSFSVCCFTATFGADGILLALAVFGLRCIVTFPCYFLQAVPSWKSSAALASLSFGRGRRTAPVQFGCSWWQRLCVTGTILLVGVCLDLFLSPWFLRLALERISV